MKKTGIILVFILLLTNVLTVTLLVISKNKSDVLNVEKEVIATVGNIEITRQQWLSTMEDNFGYDVLKDMIDKEVILSLSKKFNISVSEEEIQRQIELQQLLYEVHDTQLNTDKQLLEEIKYDLLLKEVIIHDVDIEEKELKKYYEEYKHFYSIPNSYYLSQIVVNTLEEAVQIQLELQTGSTFNVLAMERSIDEFSANQGGDIGFVSENGELPNEVFYELDSLPLNAWTSIHSMNGMFYIFYVNEKTEGKQYTFEEVKNDIRRDIALSQIGQDFTIDSLWDQAEVAWFYE